MEIYKKQELDEHYNKIFLQNRQKLLSGGIGDPFLTAPEADTRMALALLIRIGPEVSANISRYLEELKKAEPGLYYYPDEDFHITVMDILRGEPGRKIPERIDDYIRCVRSCAAGIRPFQITLDGAAASDNAVMIKGYYEEELERLRVSLRKELAEQGLLLEERYQTFSAHVTAVRIPKRLEHAAEFLSHIETERAFGQMKAEALELVFHNWYDSKKTVLDRVKLKER